MCIYMYTYIERQREAQRVSENREACTSVCMCAVRIYVPKAQKNYGHCQVLKIQVILIFFFTLSIISRLSPTITCALLL